MTQEAGLYGIKHPSKTKHKPISSSTALSFSSTLSSLISSSNPDPLPSKKRKLNTTGKDDIFRAHNRNVQARKEKDLLDRNTGQRHQTRDEIGDTDRDEIERSRKKMEDKVRLYNAMKRGEYISHRHYDGEYDDRGGLVDFDRKWAEQGDREYDSVSSDDEGENKERLNETVTYIDDLGRTRTVTRREMERQQRDARIEDLMGKERDEMRARPQAPSNIVYGDLIQHHAFNPDKTIAEQMADLAKKRDRSVTPPPETHFDAKQEVRTKGQGFYTFSHDKIERQRQMEELERARKATTTARRDKGLDQHAEGTDDRQAQMDEREIAATIKESAVQQSQPNAIRFEPALQKGTDPFVHLAQEQKVKRDTDAFLDTIEILPDS